MDANYAFIKKTNAKIESLPDRAERYLKMFSMDRDQRESIMRHLSIDVNLGRINHVDPTQPRGNLAMLDTCVNGGPTGQESGVHYAVDFGGTNIRCVRVNLKGNALFDMDQVSKDITTIPTRQKLPKGLKDKNATASELFDNIAAVVLEMMQKYGDDTRGEFFKVGFTFSFACTQIALNRAEAQAMSKGFETGSATNDPVVQKGTDVVLLLNKAFLRNSIPAEVTAILNDTTGTLISGAYLRPADYPEALIGVILGTGMNVCFADPEAHRYGYVGSVINTEVGALQKGLPFNVVDHEVDDAAPPLGSQQCEKMVSGMYLPEICRRVILKVFQHLAPPLAWAHNSMTTRECMRIAYETDTNYPYTKQVLETQLEWPQAQLTPDVLKICHDLCHAVCRRSAAVMACVVAAFAKKSGRLQPAMGGLTVAVDGSVYTKNPEYQQDFREELELAIGKELSDLIYISIAKDGSGLGAAILAATPLAAVASGRASFAPTTRALWNQRQATIDMGKSTLTMNQSTSTDKDLEKPTLTLNQSTSTDKDTVN